MKIKKLAVEEKGRTRALWEEVFSEDTREFLDYYYFIKTRDNDIYVIEDEENVPEKENGDEAEIVSMIQLNPYPLQIADRQEMTHYIIGVATRESCPETGIHAGTSGENHGRNVSEERTIYVPDAGGKRDLSAL